jgi:[ribosomal protein S5]-alanine N-acetyltransferase
LILRRLAATDDEAIFALRSDPLVNKYLGRQPAISLGDAQQFIKTIHENAGKGDSIYWAITMKPSTSLIGTICLFDISREEAEIGFELLPEFHGKGIIQEALSKVIGFSRKELQLFQLKANAHVDNLKSVRVLQRLGFDVYSAAKQIIVLVKSM